MKPLDIDEVPRETVVVFAKRAAIPGRAGPASRQIVEERASPRQIGGTRPTN
jgi:hypothetical protein